MQIQRMSEKYNKEVRVLNRTLYVLFFLSLLMALFTVAFDLRVFDVLFQIGKYACIILGFVVFIRVWATCDKAVKQHDILVDRLAEEGNSTK